VNSPPAALNSRRGDGRRRRLAGTIVGMSFAPPPVPDAGELRIRADVFAGLHALERQMASTPAPRVAMMRAHGDRTRFIRPALALAIVLAAYRVSFSTLFDLMRLDTPLAHLALVPFISLGLAVALRNRSAGPPIHDRQLDWIVGLFLMLVAFVAGVVLPARLSTQYWVWRIDLLTMPMFVAGVVALLFGTRTLWKYRYPVVFLFLAWPYPYSMVLDRWLGRFTQTTIWALNIALSRVQLAAKVPNSDSLFAVTRNGFNVQMSVASACSGANGMVGFVLVAGAFLMVARGSRIRKVLWLCTGAALVWLLNLVRILIIFWSAGEWGERVAIDGFHPYVGLVVFNIAVLVMVLLMRPFGLRVSSDRPTGRRDVFDVTSPLERPKPYRPKPAIATACVLVLALGVGIYNGELRDYDRIANSLGAPRLVDFASSQEQPQGWTVQQTDTYTQYQRFFGRSSTWNRYRYTFTSDEAAALQANVPITADIIETSDRAALSAYGVEQCYAFHGHKVTGRQSVDLGNGLIGGLLTWTSTEDDTTWTTLYWQWPIKSAGGTKYERVTLVMNDQPTNVFASPELGTGGARQLQLDLNDALRGTGSAEDRARLIETRKFMIGFAREMVAERTPAPDA
jgi:exosortase/archaeosortase family protein